MNMFYEVLVFLKNGTQLVEQIPIESDTQNSKIKDEESAILENVKNIMRNPTEGYFQIGSLLVLVPEIVAVKVVTHAKMADKFLRPVIHKIDY